MDESTALAIVNAERMLREGNYGAAQSRCEALAAKGGVSPEVEDLLGRIALAQGDLERAKSHLRRAVASDPAASGYHHALGNVYQDLGKLDRAIAAYRKALRLGPGMAECWNDLGTACAAKGLVGEAEAAYRKAIALSARHDVAYENLGMLLRAHGRTVDARRAFQGALRARILGWARRAIGRLVPARKPQALLTAAEANCARGQARLARALAAAAESRLSDSPSGLARLARIESRLELADNAVAHFRRALEIRPKDAGLHAGLGELLHRTGRLEAAERHYRSALAREPSSSRTVHGLGKLLMAMGRITEAAELFGRQLRLEPRNANAHLDFGLALAVRGKLDDAEISFHKALEIAPRRVDVHVHLGDVMRARGRAEEAARHYEIARKEDPDYEPAKLGIAQLWFSLGQVEKALEELRKLIRDDPRSSPAHRALGGMLRDIGRTEEGIRFLKTAIAINPNDLDTLRFLSYASADLGRYDEARNHLETALKLGPKRADLQSELGILEMYLGNLAESERYFRLAMEINPEIPAYHVNLGHVLVAQSRFEDGWRELESRAELLAQAEQHERFSMPRWVGEPIEGRTLLVYAEQGLGDEIVFASCIPDLARTGARCIVECDRRLEGVFKRSFPHVEVHGGDRKKPQEWFDALDRKPDLQIGAGSLPRFFRRSLEDFPRHAGYLKPDPERVEFWRRRLASLDAVHCVGLSWKGGLVRTGELRRTLSLEQLAPILRQQGVGFVSLQYTEARADLERLRQAHGIRVLHWREAIDSYEDTAALACALDGVITVCTALAHLCGAVGRPVWVLAPHSPGWRYRIGDRNPWYPSVQLFEQSVPGDWDPVIEAVRSRLAAVVAGSDSFARLS